MRTKRTPKETLKRAKKLRRRLGKRVKQAEKARDKKWEREKKFLNHGICPECLSSKNLKKEVFDIKKDGMEGVEKVFVCSCGYGISWKRFPAYEYPC
jgi:hypothetical protein